MKIIQKKLLVITIVDQTGDIDMTVMTLFA